MSKTTAELLAEIAANFPDNTSGLITPALLRAVSNDTVTSFSYGVYLTSNTPVQAASINFCDTSGGAFSVTLPSTPSVGNIVKIRDGVGTWGTNNLTILPNGQNIESSGTSLVCDTSDANFDLVWRGGGIGWGVEFEVFSLLTRTAPVFTSWVGNASGTSVANAIGRGLASSGAGTIAGLGVAHGISLTSNITTWDPAHKNVGITLTNGNLTASTAVGGAQNAFGTVAGSTDKYFEVTFGTIGNVGLGVANATQSTGVYPGNPNGVGYFNDGYIEWPGGGGFNISTFSGGQVIGVHLRASSVDLYVAGALVGTASALPAGPLFPIIFLNHAGDTGTANFGATPFAFHPANSTPWNS